MNCSGRALRGALVAGLLHVGGAVATAQPALVAPEAKFSVTRTVSNVSSNGVLLRLANGAQLALPPNSVGRQTNMNLQFFTHTSNVAQPFDEAGNAIPPPLNPQVRLVRSGGLPFWYQGLPTGAHLRTPAELAIPLDNDLGVIDALTGSTRGITDAEKLNNLRIVFFDGMEWVPVGGRFVPAGSGPDPAFSYIVASVNHLSTFALALDQTAAVGIGGTLISGVTLNNTSFTPNEDGINDATTLTFALAEPSAVTVRIFDGAGDLVRTLIQDVQFSAGAGSTQWDGSFGFASRKVPPGVYVIELKATATTGQRSSRESIMVGLVK